MINNIIAIASSGFTTLYNIFFCLNFDVESRRRLEIRHQEGASVPDKLWRVVG